MATPRPTSLEALADQCAVNIAPLLSILQADPNNDEILDQVNTVLGREDDWTSVAAVNEFVADLLEDTSKRFDLYMKAAGMWEERIEDPATAFRAYNKALKAVPGDRKALDGAVRNLEAVQEYNEAVVLAANQARRADDSTLEASCWALCARLRMEHLDDRPGALADLKKAAVADADADEVADVARLLFGSDEAAYASFLADASSDAPTEDSHFDQSTQDDIDAERPSKTDELGPKEKARIERASAASAEADTASESEPVPQEPAQAAPAQPEPARRPPPAPKPPAPDEPTDPAERLQFLKNEQRWPEVTALLEQQRTELLETPDEEGGLERLFDVLDELVDIYEGPMSDPDRAAETLASRLEVAYDVRTEQRLKSFYERLDRWEDLVEMHIRISETEEGERWAIRIKYAARICAGQLENAGRAAELYEKIRERFPDDSEANQELERIYRELIEFQPGHEAALEFLIAQHERRNDHRAVADLYMKLSGHAALPADDRARYLRQAAEIFENQLSEDQKALACWKDLLSIHPGDADAADAVIRLGQRAGDYPGVVQIIQQHLAATSDPKRKAGLLLTSARLRSLHTDDLEGATADLKRAQHEPVETSELLETAATVFGAEHDKLAEYLEQLADHTQDPELRAEAYQNAAALYRERLHNLDASIRVLEKAAKHEDAGSPFHQRLLTHYADARRWGPYLEMLEAERAVLKKAGQQSSERYREVLRAIGETLEAPLGDPAAAAKVFEELLGLEPDESIAWRLEALYASANQFEDLVAHHIRMAGSDPSRTEWQEHLMTAAGVCANDLQDPVRAAQLYEQVAAADPKAMRPLEALCDLYEERAQWQQLAEACRRTAAAHAEAGSDPAIAASFLHRAASVLESRLRVPADAAAVLEEILSQDPKDQRAATSLVRIRREQHDPLAFVHALRLLAKSAADRDQRRDTRIEEGRTLLTAVGSPKEASAAFRHALEVDDQSLVAWRGLQEALRQTGDDDALLNALDAELERVGDAPRLAELQREAARILERADEDDAARERWERARSHEPENLQTLHALLKHYQRMNDTTRQSDVLQALARHETTPEERADAHYRHGVLLRDTDTPRAVAEAEQALELNPKHKEAVAFLRGIAEQQEDWERVVTLLDRESHLPAPAKSRSELLHDAAQILRTRLASGEQAAAFDARAVQVDPENADAARPLADWYFRHTQYQHAKPLYDRFGVALALEDTDEGRADVYYRHAVVCRELLQVDEAINHLHEAREACAGYIAAYEMLGALHRERREWPHAREALQPLLKLGASKKDAALLLKTHLSLAEITEADGDRDAAIEHYRRILGINASHRGATDALLRLYSSDNRWRESVAVLDFMLRQTTDATETARIQRERGRLIGERLKNWSAAADAFVQAADAAPDDLEIRKELAAALEKAGRWQKAADEHLPLAQAETLPATERADHWVARAEILHKRLGDIFGAMKAYEGALKVEPREKRALGALATLYEKNEQWPELVSILQRMADSIPANRGVSIADLRTRAAWFLVHRMEDTETAVGELRMALEAAPDYPAALDKLAEIVSTDPAYDGEALDVHHRLLRKNPFRASSLRTLVGVYERKGRNDRSAWMGNLLRLLERPSAAPLQRGSGAIDLVGRHTQEVVSPDELRKRVLHPAEHGPLTELLALLNQYARQVMPPQLEQWGVEAPPGTEDGPGIKRMLNSLKGAFGGGAEEQETSDSPGPRNSPQHIQQVVDGLFGILPMGRTRVVDSAAGELFLTIEQTAPPLLILGPQLANAWAGDAAQALTRAALHIAAGRSLFVQLGPEGTSHMVVSAIATLMEGKQAAGLPEQYGVPAEYAQAVKKALPRKLKKESKDLVERALAQLQASPNALTAWLQTLEWSGDRAVLLLTGDMPAAFWVALSRDETQPAVDNPLDLYQQLRNSRSCQELATFAASPEFFRLRDRFGLGTQASIPQQPAPPQQPAGGQASTVVAPRPGLGSTGDTE